MSSWIFLSQNYRHIIRELKITNFELTEDNNTAVVIYIVADEVISLYGISRYTKLEELQLYADIVNLTNHNNNELTNLRSLRFIHTKKITDYQALGNLISLSVLDVSNSMLTDFSFIPKFPNLRHVLITPEQVNLLYPHLRNMRNFRLEIISDDPKYRRSSDVSYYKIKPTLDRLIIQLIKDKIRLLWSRFFYSRLDNQSRSRYTILAISEDKIIN